MKTPESLKEELDLTSKKANFIAVKNYYFAFFCLLGALVISGLAVVLVASDSTSRALRTTFTALPGLFILANQVFKFDLRSRWAWLKYHKVKGLARELRDQGLGVADVSKRLTLVELEAEKEYPPFDFSFLRGGGKPGTKV